MAVTAITPEKLTINTFDTDAIAMTAASSATDGFTIDCTNIADQKLLLLFYNSNGSATARTITIKAGNGIQGTDDLAATIAAGKYGMVNVESGKFKGTSGTYKGLLHLVPDNVELKMAAVVLP